MKHTILMAFAVVLSLLLPSAIHGAETGKMHAHHVFFTLKDKSPAAQDALVAACYKYLKKQQGVVSFAAGKRATAMTREVNDQEFDVSLHIVFKSTEDQNVYQKDAQHQKFIDENSANWAKVRVFDSNID